MSSRLQRPREGWAVRACAEPYGFVPSDASVVACEGWLDELVVWNAKLDLTAARTGSDAVELMLADAFVLAQLLPEKASVVDVGTGAGGPALGLAFLRPDLSVTLVEPLAKRTSFLRTVLSKTSRTDVRVERAAGEDLAEKGETFDVALSRATLKPPEWLALGLRLVKPEGLVAVLVSQEPAPEADDAMVQAQRAYTLSHTGAPRTVLLYRKVAPGA